MSTITESNRQRKFKRYKAKTIFQLALDTQTFNCKLLDYSDGIKAVIYDSPLITPGTSLDIKIPHPSIDLKGEVVWSQRFSSEILVGVKRKDTIKGTFKDFKLSDILIGLKNSSSTGTLEVRSGSIIKKIHLRYGEMVFASSNEEEDRLAELIFRAGKISYEQYCNTIRIYNEGRKKQGTILVELGYLTSRELISALKNQIEEIIVSLFTIENGEFEFDERLSSEYDPLILNLNTPYLIYRGIKKINKLAAIKRFSPDINMHLYRSPKKSEVFKTLSLDDIDKRVLSFVSDKISVKNLLSLSPFNDFQTLKSLYALSGIDLIGIHEEDSELSPEDIVSEFTSEKKKEFLSQVEETYKKCESREYYQILNISPTASSLEIKNAYYKMATKFHPDKHSSYASDDVKLKLTKIFTFLTEAYTVLTNPNQRKEYDRSISSRVKTVQKHSDSFSHARTLFNDGLLEMWNNNFSQSAKLFHRALQIDSSQGKYFYYYSYALRKQDKVKEALEAINNALTLEPDNADYLAELGYVCIDLGLDKRAQMNFEKALKISPSNKKAQAGLIQIEEHWSLKDKMKNSKIISFFTSSNS
jgi:curved DNA-binding protein CbpA